MKEKKDLYFPHREPNPGRGSKSAEFLTTRLRGTKQLMMEERDYKTSR